MTPSDTGDKRRLLLDAAAALFRQQGFEKTSVSQIVKKAGVAQGTFYLYFPSKAHLVPALAQSIIDHLLIRLHVHAEGRFATLEDLVETLIRDTYAVTEEHRELITFCYSGMGYFQTASQWEAIYAPYYAWLEQRLLELRQAGLMECDSDLVYTANFVVGVLEQGAENFFVFGGDRKYLDSSRQQLQSFLLRALRP